VVERLAQSLQFSQRVFLPTGGVGGFAECVEHAHGTSRLKMAAHSAINFLRPIIHKTFAARQNNKWVYLAVFRIPAPVI
jgi:hypothetical protein